MFTTHLVNLYNGNIFKTSLYIYMFQDEKCRLMRNLSLSKGCPKNMGIEWRIGTPCMTVYYYPNILGFKGPSAKTSIQSIENKEKSFI